MSISLHESSKPLKDTIIDMYPTRNESKLRERIAARESVSEIPKAEPSSRNPLDEAHPTPLVAITDGGGSFSQSAKLVDAPDKSTKPCDENSAKALIPEASGESSVFRPSRAEDIDGLIRSLDLADGSTKQLNAAH